MKIQQFVLQMLQNLQIFANFQKCQLDNFVDFKEQAAPAAAD